MALQNWSTVANNNGSAAPGINMLTGSAPSTVHPSVRQLMADVATWYASPEWLYQADTPVYVNATSFTVTTNRTAVYSVGRRISAIGTSYTIYGTITASVFGALTTVTVAWDSGALDATVSSVAVGLLQNQLTTLAPKANPAFTGNGSIASNWSVGASLSVGGASNAFTAANVGIEIGSLSVANSPYFDFHSSGNNIDYDARIMASGGNTTPGNGALTYSAYGGHLFNGGVVMSNGLTVNNTADALVKSVGLGGYGGFWAEGSGTNNAYLYFANTANGERFRLTSDFGRNLYFSGDSGVSSHFVIFSNGDITPLGNMMSAQVNGAWDGAFRALTVRSAASSGTVANFGLLRQGLYGLDVGLDSDNGFKIGGWSQGTGVFRFTLDTAGNGVFTGNVTAYSDGRDKQDWRPLAGIKQQLLGLSKWGSYMDVRSGERKVGIVAQDFLRTMPEAVLTDESTGRYSFAYGQAAMAALVAYAHDNEADLNALRSEVAAIKAELGAQHG